LRLLPADVAKPEIASPTSLAEVTGTAKTLADLAPVGISGTRVDDAEEGGGGGHAEEKRGAGTARLEQVEGIEHVLGRRARFTR
jgi:hypothetical protein